MTGFSIMFSNDVYHTILVVIGEHRFLQTIVSEKSGDDLTAFIQSYVDDYETAWLQVRTPDTPSP